jgi:hypothetical protein
MTSFWKNWLTLWCLGVGVFGLALYGAVHPATTAPIGAVFELLGNPLPADPDRHLRFALSLMGAISVGWAITFYAAFRAAWALDDAASRPVWRWLALAGLAWYAIDSIASVMTGFPLNVLSNTVLAAALLIPIWASGRLGAKP